MLLKISLAHLLLHFRYKDLNNFITTRTKLKAVASIRVERVSRNVYKFTPISTFHNSCDRERILDFANVKHFALSLMFLYYLVVALDLVVMVMNIETLFGN